MDSGLHSARPSTPRSRARNGNASSARLGQDGLAEVRETYRRVMEVTVKKPSKNSMSAPPKSLGLAQQLSANRQRRREISDRSSHGHALNVYHMYRRMENMYSLAERKKNPFDATVYPTLLRRNKPTQRVSVDSLTTPRGRPATPRPGSAGPVRMKAPAAKPKRPQSAPSRAKRGEYGGLKKKASRKAAGLEKDLASLTLSKAKEEHDSEKERYRIFKAAMMNEVVEGRIYEEKKLEALFKRYLNMNAQEHWPILKSVIADLRVELDISTKTKA